MFTLHWLFIRAKCIRNSFRQDARAFLLSDAWHALIIVFGLTILYIFLTLMFRFADKTGVASFDFALILLSFSLLVFLPLLVYSAVVCSLSFLFQKEELHFYFSLPIGKLSVFTVKLLQTYFHTSWMVFLGFLTFLAAIQQSFHTTLWLYFTGIISFLIFCVIPVCLAVTAVIIISRFVPFVQSRGVLAVVSLLTGSLLVSAIRVMQPEQLVTAQGKMRLIAFVENLYRPWMTALPSEWVTSILFAQCQNNTRGVVLNFLSLAVLALLAVLVVYAVAGLFFKKAWADAVVASPVVRAKAGRDFVLNFFPSRVRGFIRKDTLSFQRDTLEKGSLLILIPLVFVYLYSMYLLNRHIQNVNEEQVFSFLYVYLFNFFYASVVIAGLSGRWVLPSVSAEGNNFKLIKKSPAPLKDFIQAKFLIGFVPLLVLAEALILSSSVILHMPLAFIALAACTIGILCFGITLICLIVGMRKADFSIASPLDFALSMRGLVCLTWELVFVTAVLVLVGIPTALVLYRGFSVSSIAAISISLLVILVVMVMLVRLYTSSLLQLSRRIA